MPARTAQGLWRLLCLIMLLGGAWTGAAAASAQQQATWRTLDQQAHKQPAATAAQLLALAQQLDHTDALRWQALGLAGFLQGLLRQAADTQHTAAELDELARRWPDAGAAADLARANLLIREGPLQRGAGLARSALDRLGASASGTLRWRILMVLASAHGRLGQFDAATRYHQQAQALAETLDGSFAVLTLIYHAQSLHNAQQLELGQSVLNKAHQRARALGDEYAMAQALTVQTYFDTSAKAAPALREHLEQALAHARRSGSREQLALCLGNLADDHIQAGRPEQGLALAREARALGDVATQAMLDLSIGTALIGLHRLAEGMQHAQSALAATREQGHITALAGYHLDLAEALERAGYLHEAVQVLQAQRRLAFEAMAASQQQAVLDLQETQEADARQRNLDLLARDNAMAQQALAHQQLLINLGAAGAALAAALAGTAAWLLNRLRRHNQSLVRAAQRLKHLSEHDALTGLANRRQWQQWLMASPGQLPAGPLVLMLIDLDHFKRVNDRLGHAAGDAVLREVAHRLAAAAPPGALLVRWGGEEFLLIAPCADAKQASQLASHMLQAVHEQPVIWRPGQAGLTITASLGWGLCNAPSRALAQTWAELLPEVDQALYQAKARGRNGAWGVAAHTA